MCIRSFLFRDSTVYDDSEPPSLRAEFLEPRETGAILCAMLRRIDRVTRVRGPLPFGRGTETPRASVASVLVALPILALPAILLPGCATTGCEEWVTRVESVRVCNSKGTKCSYQDQSVPYCARKIGQRAAPAAAPVAAKTAASALPPRETRVPEKIVKPAPAPLPPVQKREAPTPQKIAKADPAPNQPEKDRQARTPDATGAPNLTLFWRSLFSASRYSGLRYGKFRKITLDPATAPASSPRVAAALKKHVRSVVRMQVASERNSTPMDHRLTVVVYQTHDREAAIELYRTMMRDEWRARKAQAQPGVTLVVVNTGDRKHPDTSGQRIRLQRGSYVIEVDEWKSIHKDAAGKPLPGKQFPHSHPISPEAVAKAVIRRFPAN
jgi:hypothetical protein